MSARTVADGVPPTDFAPTARWELLDHARKAHAINEKGVSLCGRHRCYLTPLVPPVKVPVARCCRECLAYVVGLA